MKLLILILSVFGTHFGNGEVVMNIGGIQFCSVPPCPGFDSAPYQTPCGELAPG